MTTDDTGFVYVMGKESAPSFFKIGKTEKKPQLRAVELDNTDSPSPSIVVFYVFCEDFSRLELLAHKELETARVRQNREWFKCTQSEAISGVRRAAESASINILYEKELYNHDNKVDDFDFEAEEADKDDIQEALERIVYEGRTYQIELRRYKLYLQQRLSELNAQKHSNAGDRRIARKMYEDKAQEITGTFKAKAQRSLFEIRNNIDEKTYAKLTQFVNDIENHVVLINDDFSSSNTIAEQKKANHKVNDFLANHGSYTK